jgi:hypothetical protein
VTITVFSDVTIQELNNQIHTAGQMH